VLELRGDLVEEHSGGLRDTLLANVDGDARRTVELRDLLVVLDAAAKDKNISSVYLLLDELDGGGLAMLHEAGAAIDRVKAAGKPVIAWGGNFDQKRYLLASHASEVYMHPMGMVLIEGFGRRRNYYRDALDKLGVTVNLMKVGTYKSFAEPYISNGPSQAATEADTVLYGALWNGLHGHRREEPQAGGQVPCCARHRAVAATNGSGGRQCGAGGAASKSWSTASRPSDESARA
jgi:protease-4